LKMEKSAGEAVRKCGRASSPLPPLPQRRDTTSAAEVQ
jgi:hypothetical protein